MGISWTAEELERALEFALRVKAATYDIDGDLIVDSAFLRKEVELIERIGASDMIGKPLLNDVKKFLEYADGARIRIYKEGRENLCRHIENRCATSCES